MERSKISDIIKRHHMLNLKNGLVSVYEAD